MSEISHSEELTKEIITEQPERPQEGGAVEQKQKKIKLIDLRTLGKVSVERGTSRDLSASHEVVKISGSEAYKYAKGREAETTWLANKAVTELEVPLSGTVESVLGGQRLAETYKYDYVELPDGSVATQKLESVYSDGSKETLERKFSDEGKALKETDILDGKLREVKNMGYDADGTLAIIEQIKYDEQGQEVGRVEVKKTGKDSATLTEVQDGKVVRTEELRYSIDKAPVYIQAKKEVTGKGGGRMLPKK